MSKPYAGVELGYLPEAEEQDYYPEHVERGTREYLGAIVLVNEKLRPMIHPNFVRIDTGMGFEAGLHRPTIDYPHATQGAKKFADEFRLMVNNVIEPPDPQEGVTDGKVHANLIPLSAAGWVDRSMRMHARAQGIEIPGEPYAFVAATFPEQLKPGGWGLGIPPEFEKYWDGPEGGFNDQPTGDPKKDALQINALQLLYADPEQIADDPEHPIITARAGAGWQGLRNPRAIPFALHEQSQARQRGEKLIILSRKLVARSVIAAAEHQAT